MSNRLVEVAENFVSGGLLLFLGDFSSTIILAIGSILVARLLGPSSYGLYSLIFVIPSLFLSLIGLGLENAVMVYPAKFKAENRIERSVEIFKSALIFRSIVGLTFSIIGFLLADFLSTNMLNRPELGFYVKLASIIILFQGLFTLIYSGFIGLDKAHTSSFIKILMSIIKVSFSLLLIIIGLGIIGAILGHVLGYTTAGIIGILLFFISYRNLKNNSYNTVDKNDYSFTNDIKLMINYGIPLYFSSLLGLIAGQYQLILLAFYTSNTEIGNFNAAVNLSSIISILVTPIGNALFPAFSKLSSEDENARKFFNLSVKYISLLIIPTTIAVIIFSPDLVRLLYGKEYMLASIYLPIYIILYLYTGLGSYSIIALFNGLGKTQLTLKVQLMNLTILIPLALFLTMMRGVLGLILTLLISNLLSLIYGFTLARKKFNITISFRDQLMIYLSSLLSALPSILFLHFISFGSSFFNSLLNLAIGAIIYLIVYLTLLPALKAIDEHDIENLKQIFRKIKILWPIIRLLIDYETKLLRVTKSH